MDECSWEDGEKSVKDHSGNGYDALVKDLTNTKNDGIIEKLCKSGDFTKDSTSDYLVLDNNILNGKEEFTISMWMKTDHISNSGGGDGVISGANKGSDNEVLLWFNNKTTFIPHIKGKQKSISISNIADNKWHHFVWTRKGEKNCAYVDGNFQGCVTIRGASGALKIDKGGLIVGQEQDSVGGRFDKGQDYEGYLDELKIYDNALSEDQIKNIYNNEKNGRNWDGSKRKCECIKPIVEYRMDECHWEDGEKSVKDHSGNGYDAMAQGNANTSNEAKLCKGGNLIDNGNYVKSDKAP
jgi:hypothetical protein